MNRLFCESAFYVCLRKFSQQTGKFVNTIIEDTPVMADIKINNKTNK